MEINKEVKAKIFDYILQKNLTQTLSSLPEKGSYFIESAYELALNDKNDKYYFVVSRKIMYHNYSISDRRFGIYAFDKNSGELAKDFDEKNGCYLGFFKDLKIVETII